MNSILIYRLVNPADASNMVEAKSSDLIISSIIKSGYEDAGQLLVEVLKLLPFTSSIRTITE